jgi:hypothetical protein
LNPRPLLIIRNLLILRCAECSKYNGCSGSLHLITPKNSRIQLRPDGDRIERGDDLVLFTAALADWIRDAPGHVKSCRQRNILCFSATEAISIIWLCPLQAFSAAPVYPILHDSSSASTSVNDSSITTGQIGPRQIGPLPSRQQRYPGNGACAEPAGYSWSEEQCA